MRFDDFIPLLLIGALGAACLVFYCAIGMLVAAAFNIMPWTITWFACLLAWPVVVWALIALAGVFVSFAAIICVGARVR